MNRIIQVKVSGDYLTKDTDQAGTQHEANASRLRITFDESWDNYTKSVTFWDARGANPVTRVLTVDMLENISDSRVYLCPIPGEPMAVAGKFQFVIEGYLAGRRQRAVGDVLRARPAPRVAEEIPSTDPTPTQAQQIQCQIDAVMESIRRAIEAANSADAAFAAAQAAHEAASAATAEAAEATQAAENAKNAVISKHADRHGAGGDDVITPAMIGAVPKQTIVAVGYDLNGVLDSGFYRLSTGHANMPMGCDYGQLLVIQGGGDTITQICIAYNNVALMRSGNPLTSTGAWSAWRQMLFVGDDPSLINAAQASTIYNIDDVVPTGFYRVAGNAGTFPAGAENGTGTLINIFWDGNYVDQVFTSYHTFRRYRRRRNGANWEPWYMIYDEFVVTKSTYDIGEGVAMTPGGFYVVYE